MKKFIICAENLNIKRAGIKLSHTIKAVKLTFVQAVHFQQKFTSFEEMLKVYGENKQLQLGEQYKGYIAIFLGCWKQDVFLLDGAICKKDASTASEYDVLLKRDDGIWPGVFRQVWNVNSCRFDDWIKVLQLYNKIDNDVKPDELDKKLKEDIIDAIINKSVLKLSDIEFAVLLSFFPNNFFTIFTEVE